MKPKDLNEPNKSEEIISELISEKSSIIEVKKLVDEKQNLWILPEEFKAKVALEVNNLSTNQDELEKVFLIFFISFDIEISVFYENYSEISYHFPELAASTWLVYLSKFDSIKKQNFLLTSVNDEKYFSSFTHTAKYIFNGIHFNDNELQLASNFLNIFINHWSERNIIGNTFQEALFIYCKKNFEQVLKVIDYILGLNINGSYAQTLSILIGIMRTIDESTQICKFEDQMLHSYTVLDRVAYYNSFSLTYTSKCPSIEELEKFLELENSLSQDEITKKFEVARQLFNHYSLNESNEEIIQSIFQWFQKNSGNHLSCYLKKLILSTLSNSKVNIVDCVNVIKTLFPFNEDDYDSGNNSLRCLDRFIHWLLTKDYEITTSFITDLIIIDLNVVHNFFSISEFKDLISTMIDKNPDLFSIWLKKIFKSQNSNLIHVGILLLDEDFDLANLELEEIDLIKILPPLILLSNRLNPKTICKICKLLDLNISTINNQDILEIYESYVKFQSKNFPGECRDNWHLIENKSSILDSAIKDSISYFQNLRDRKQSLLKFSIPSLKSISKKIIDEKNFYHYKEAKSKTVLLSRVKETHYIYGKEIGSITPNRDGELILVMTPLQTLEQSFEIPMMSCINPEEFISIKKDIFKKFGSNNE